MSSSSNQTVRESQVNPQDYGEETHQGAAANKRTPDCFEDVTPEAAEAAFALFPNSHWITKDQKVKILQLMIDANKPPKWTHAEAEKRYFALLDKELPDEIGEEDQRLTGLWANCMRGPCLYFLEKRGLVEKIEGKKRKWTMTNPAKLEF